MSHGFEEHERSKTACLKCLQREAAISKAFSRLGGLTNSYALSIQLFSGKGAAQGKKNKVILLLYITSSSCKAINVLVENTL